MPLVGGVCSGILLRLEQALKAELNATRYWVVFAEGSPRRTVEAFTEKGEAEMFARWFEANVCRLRSDATFSCVVEEMGRELAVEKIYQDLTYRLTAVR